MSTEVFINRNRDAQISTIILPVSIAAVFLSIITVFFVVIIISMCLFFQWKSYNAQDQLVSSSACYTPDSDDLQT